MENHTSRHTIREWREQVFFENQTEFAERIGINISTLSLWETGKRKPRPRMQRLVAERLGLKPQQIIFPQQAKEDEEN